MLLFFSVIVLTFFTALFLLFSEVKLDIEEFEWSSNSGKFKPKYEGTISLYFLKKIRLLKHRINNENIEKILGKKMLKTRIEKIKQSDSLQKQKQRQVVINLLKNIKEEANIEKFEFQMFVDLENVIVTSLVVGILSSVIPNFIRKNIRKHNHNEYRFEILPVYKKENYIYLKLSSIISIKVVHIINMLKKIGGKENEGTSNRRLNVNCYGKY